MSDLISRSALLAKMKQTSRYFDVKFDIEETPAVDAVPVVRCKDCKYWEIGKDYEPYCNHWGNMMADTVEDDFCSFGERKDNETD